LVSFFVCSSSTHGAPPLCLAICKTVCGGTCPPLRALRSRRQWLAMHSTPNCSLFIHMSQLVDSIMAHDNYLCLMSHEIWQWRGFNGGGRTVHDLGPSLWLSDQSSKQSDHQASMSALRSTHPIKSFNRRRYQCSLGAPPYTRCLFSRTSSTE